MSDFSFLNLEHGTWEINENHQMEIENYDIGTTKRRAVAVSTDQA